MKQMIIFATATAIVFMTTLPCSAEEASVALGKKLFDDPGLGASQNSTSCSVCHPDGEGLEMAGEKANLPEMINKCIVGPLQGEKINKHTVAMQSLRMYIESLGN